MFAKDMFRVAEATTPADLIKVYELRHLVYCVERHLEPTRSTSQETDELDLISRHVAVWEKATGRLCGTARIIPAGASKPIPFGTVASHMLPMSLEGFGELSRYTIHPDYVAMKFEGQNLFGAVTVGILKGALDLSREISLKRWGMLIERRFHRALRMLRFSFEAEGDLVEFHGTRMPCIFNLATGFDGLKRRCPQAWSYLQDRPTSMSTV